MNSVLVLASRIYDVFDRYASLFINVFTRIVKDLNIHGLKAGRNLKTHGTATNGEDKTWTMVDDGFP